MDELPELLYAAAGRTITALDRFSGRPAWRIKLPRFFGGLITLVVRGNELYAARGGYVYCLDRFDGRVLWERGVGSTGGIVLMALAGQTPEEAEMSAAAAHAAQQAAGASAAAGAAAAG